LCCLLLPHSTYLIRQFLVFVLFVGYCFGEIMCIWDSYVYQKGGFFSSSSSYYYYKSRVRGQIGFRFSAHQ